MFYAGEIYKLARLGLSAAVTLSAATGYFIATPVAGKNLIFLVSGLFLVAGGSSALNQFTERKYDALMERTRSRPVPSGSVSEFLSLLIASSLLLSGISLLWLATGLSALIATVNIVMYNLIYTRLKRITRLALIPGALVGALPPLIGYAASGLSGFSAGIISFSVFMFLWQIPHFLLISIRFGDEYRKAGFRMVFSLKGSFFDSLRTPQGFRSSFVVLNSVSLIVMLAFIFYSVLSAS